MMRIDNYWGLDWPEFGPTFGIGWPCSEVSLLSILTSRTDNEFSVHEIARISAGENPDGSTFMSSGPSCEIPVFHDLPTFRQRVIAGGQRHNRKHGIEFVFPANESQPAVNGDIVGDDEEIPGSNGDPPKRLRRQAQAIAYYLTEAEKRPPAEITLAEIVRKLDCAGSTLSKGRAPKLHAIMEAHKSLPSAGAIRKGTKDADGNLEAIEG